MTFAAFLPAAPSINSTIKWGLPGNILFQKSNQRSGLELAGTSRPAAANNFDCFAFIEISLREGVTSRPNRQ